jgi:hypothetical protein
MRVTNKNDITELGAGNSCFSSVNNFYSHVSLVSEKISAKQNFVPEKEEKCDKIT